MHSDDKRELGVTYRGLMTELMNISQTTQQWRIVQRCKTEGMQTTLKMHLLDTHDAEIQINYKGNKTQNASSNIIQNWKFETPELRSGV